MGQFTLEDCTVSGLIENLFGKVLVLSPKAAEKHDGAQLFFCVNECCMEGATPFVPAWSLHTGEMEYLAKGEILGLLRPERLPDDARLQLSQIRPSDVQTEDMPFYTGFCFLPDGRFTAGVLLHGWSAAQAYAGQQAPYQHTVRICDEKGVSVMEVMQGKVTFVKPAIKK